MSTKRYIENKKNPTDSANYQPSLFDNGVLVTHRDRHLIVSHRAKKRKRKRLRRHNMEQINRRQALGLQIAKTANIREENNRFLVPSQTATGIAYKVNFEEQTCTCSDFTWRRESCKHIYAIQAMKGAFDSTNLEMVSAPRHTQNWSAYNRSQTSEKREFLKLLSDLTHTVEEREQENGRPSLPLGDMLFSLIYKVYSQMSSRRFTTDLQAAYIEGLITECPHYNSLIRYMDKPELTPILESLVEAAAKPLSALEDRFAVDSTGFSISNSVSWSRAKYQDQKMMKQKNWIKLHCAVGTRTNVITSAKVSDKTGADYTHFVPVVEGTRRNFEIKELTADKIYNSEDHANYAASHGIDMYVPFKDNMKSVNPKSSAIWSKMFHYFSFNRSEFLQKYNLRSNVESTFGALKMKFGGLLKSKTFQGQVNETLAKVVAFNLVTLVHAMNEFGIEIEGH
jgi:transposase